VRDRASVVHRVGCVVLAASLLTGCQFSIDLGPASTSDGADMAVWDLTETNDVAAIGWPEDDRGVWERRSEDGLERILLPEGLVLEGFDRAEAERAGGFGEPMSDGIRSMGVAYTNRTVPEVRDLAVDLANKIGDDPTNYTDWAGRNANGVDYSFPAANRGRGGSIPLGHISIALRTRAVGEERADLIVNLFWLSESATPPDDES
jgi:hypothetical protein